MYEKDKIDQRIIDYTKNIEINTFFNEKGEDIRTILEEIIVNNCNPIERKKLDI